MKSIYYKISFFTLLLFSAVSCKDLSDLNIDPDRSPTANDAQVLTSAIGYLGYVVDADLNQNSFLWAQYWTWGPGVSLGNAERYISDPADRNGMWSRSYASVLTDLRFLSKSTNPAYVGISKVLTAYMYQALVDQFGDIPYSEALRGEIADGSILTPAYDGGAAIYADLVKKLDEAVVDLNSPLARTVGNEDLIYKGSTSKWIKFANTLKLRLLMRQSVTGNQTTLATEVKNVIAAGNFIEAPADRPQIAFSGATGNENPMYALQESGVGYFYIASNATLNVLRSLSDPRINAFFKNATTGPTPNAVRGINQGDIDSYPFTDPRSHYSQGGTFSYGKANSVILMSEWEAWFLRAEAGARYGTVDNDVTAFNNAVTASFTYLTLSSSAASYITGLGYTAASSLQNKLKLIGVQKWISMNGLQENEGWIESRRFDTPQDRMFTGTGGIFQKPTKSALPQGTYPSAWLYPESEKSYNPKSPAQREITDKVFWDN